MEHIAFAANGVVFVLLGEQLPNIVGALPTWYARQDTRSPSGCCSM
jgi:NhaP-type Na+/H+ or K+/H+ antiporter